MFPFSILDIVREPTVSCKDHKIDVGKIQCSVQNFSHFVNLSVFKDHATPVSTYPTANVCIPHVEDKTVATCNLKLSTKGSYKICVDYNSSVPHESTKPRCSKDVDVQVHVSNSKSFRHSLVPRPPQHAWHLQCIASDNFISTGYKVHHLQLLYTLGGKPGDEANSSVLVICTCTCTCISLKVGFYTCVLMHVAMYMYMHTCMCF